MKTISNVKLATVEALMTKGANKTGIRLGAIGKRCTQIGAQDVIGTILKVAKSINGEKRNVSVDALEQAIVQVVPCAANAPRVEAGTVPKFLLPKKKKSAA